MPGSNTQGTKGGALTGAAPAPGVVSPENPEVGNGGNQVPGHAQEVAGLFPELQGSQPPALQMCDLLRRVGQAEREGIKARALGVVVMVVWWWGG